MFHLPSVSHKIFLIGFVPSSYGKVDAYSEGYHHSQCEDHIIRYVETLSNGGTELHSVEFL